MNQNQTNASGRGCIELLSLAAFMWGAAMMFPKTVDLLANFAPNTFMGYTDMAGWWAMGSALLIEGVMVVMKLKTWISPSRNLIEWAWDAVLTIAPFILSTLAQIFDGMVVRGVLAEQPEQVRLLVTWLVPALPSVMIGLLVVLAIIQSAPAGIFDGLQNNGATSRLPTLKIGNPFTAVRDWWQKKPEVKTKKDPTSLPTANK